jgi:hypothetical protein
MTERMPDERSFTLRQIDQARTDFASIDSDLQFIMERLSRMPTRKEIWRATLLGVTTGACLVSCSANGRSSA